MKIGFCFLVKNNISHQNIWQKFFASANKSNYSIYIHAKSNIVSTYLDNVFVDPRPLKTGWASISLVHATNRLLETAFSDGCTAAVFLSGDTLPLWNFKTIYRLCAETLFSLQPVDELYQYQVKKNQREHKRIKDFYHLDESINLVKQNMFFSIKRADFEAIRNVNIHDFPCKEVPDEYFWANQLIIKGHEVNDCNFIFVNDDPTKTQSLSWIVDSNLLHHTRSMGYLFIRKVKRFSDVQSEQYYSNLIK
ncbi:beta-1,6-N-acetylglucosaminyltransferase [Synechococcus sp. A15-44]|uniref:beta-1,6-N-acetylglucosaminyltransferase n=1 Tax=Synechococcus sp. A15-44 TaxID=1050646 RepID=UPI001644EF07|nr:beta-1,6-N-acetylglucosaminyltransferase [Synechococcus sp. A15-44]QNI65168.1 hypothetical protein SynA1544_02241 [Synechococcus sp. A15-44]